MKLERKVGGVRIVTENITTSCLHVTQGDCCTNGSEIEMLSEIKSEAVIIRSS